MYLLLDILSSPEPKILSELLVSEGDVPASVDIGLLLNHWVNNDKILQEWYLHKPLSELFKNIHSMQNSGFYDNQKNCF